MLLQSPSFSKNLLTENLPLSQSLFLNKNFFSYNNHNYNNKIYFTETPQHKNMNSNNYNFYNDHIFENNFNEEKYFKGIISNSITAELKNTSNNFINLINTPQFERICHKIFFPQNDSFNLSSNQNSPNNNDNKKKDNNSSLFDFKVNNNNNIDIQINKIKKNNFLESPKNINNIKNRSRLFSFSKSNSKSKSIDKKIISSKKRKIDNNLNKIEKSMKIIHKNNNINKYINSNNNINNNLPVKKTKKYIRDIKALFQNQKLDIYEQPSISCSSSTKGNTINENKIINNLLKNKKISKKVLKQNSKRPKKYNILDEETKKRLLIDAKNMKTKEVAKKYGISTRNINRWKKTGIKRKKGSGRKLGDPGLEKKILIWFNFQDKKNITSKDFKKKALELSNNINFRASSGWLTNMKKKYHIKFK